MRESTTYQHILNEGRTEVVNAWHRSLLRQGRIRLGEPDVASAAALNAISDLERLERLSERLLLVTTWEELLAAP
jgi:hypothetical protein